ncbi:LOG family protein [Gephyromycinifex aptenodytis]|uniref:LOG family protein n=1 Tax=Gephyromycinifex aptenodytis TaxID=2716227 RepID=UPI0014454BB6|nr:LOG family protein [Gephyromycinifex aptenodytis]
MEIEAPEQLRARLEAGASLAGARFQNLDLGAFEEALLARDDLEGLIVLGGSLSHRLAAHLTSHRALVFPAAPHAPVNPYRESLYTPEELYDPIEKGYAATIDGQAYAWSRAADNAHDAYISLLQAAHDVSITDALDEWIAGAPVVGVMGGHALRRGSRDYAQAAHLAHRLARHGLVVATGGGPGAMEAANLGAFAGTPQDLDSALAQLAAVPGFEPSIDDWVVVALAARERLLQSGAAEDRSVGIPTWFYGHEPPNVFCNAIAKFFSNALREDGLLARSSAGVVVLPGAAGTVQEIFQAVTPRYYSDADDVPALVLVGREHWTQTVPVWQALEALGHERALGRAVRLVDGLEEAAVALGA